MVAVSSVFIECEHTMVKLLTDEQCLIPIRYGDNSMTTYGSNSSHSSTVCSTVELDGLVSMVDLKECGNDFQPPAGVDSPSLGDVFFRLLGFESNPMRQQQPEAAGTEYSSSRNSAAADLQLSMLSNFSTAYNVISISLSLQMMKQGVHASPSTPRVESVCSSALIAGMIIGQLTLGTLGDVLGRHKAMAVVMLLQVAAAFGSAFSCDMYLFNAEISVFEALALWRFLLGLGCGGVYPLSATLTTESSHSGNDRAKLVALAFSFQGIGYLVVPVIALLIVSVFGESSYLGWRILLGLGCVPGAALTVVRYRGSSQVVRRQSTPSKVSHKFRKSEYVHLEEHLPPPRGRVVPVSIITAIFLQDDLIRKILGTAGSWLLFDILFYGNTLFQPVVLLAAFGASETVAKSSQDTFVLAFMALPGYFITVWAVGRQSPKWIQLQGFFVMGILYLTIGILFDLLSGHKLALLSVYGSTFFFSNYGPNATTFMLPSMTFSRACRSTLNGVSAACGKAGALIGATAFVSACHHYGQETVFLFCALLSFAGCFLTLFCVSDEVGQGSGDDDDDHPDIDESMHSELETLTIAGTPVAIRHIYSQPSIFDSHPSP